MINFLSKPLWNLPTVDDYNNLLKDSEYASWVIYNRYYLNHYTISVHELSKNYNTLEKFNKFLIRLNIKLNDSGGIIKKSKDGLLLQSSSVANKVEATFANNETKLISGSYVEFAERRILQNFSNYPLIKLLQNIEEMVLKLQMLIRFLKVHLLNKQVEIKILNHKNPCKSIITRLLRRDGDSNLRHSYPSTD